jgi:hypothetical protein
LIFYQVYQTRQATDQDLNDSSIRQSLDPDATNYHEVEEKTIKKAKKKTKGNTTASSEESLSITPPPTPAKPVVTKDSSNDKKESKAIDTLKENSEALSDDKIYTCIGAICSPAFVVGSTRQLRRVSFYWLFIRFLFFKVFLTLLIYIDNKILSYSLFFLK